MSTIFGIPKRRVDIQLGDQDGLYDYISTEFFDQIWFRSMGNCRWLNPLAELLPDYTKVYALDNGQQGVFTIGDIKQKMQQQEKQN